MNPVRRLGWFRALGRNLPRAAALAAAEAFAVARATEPIPSFYEEPGLSPNREVLDQHVNERIDPFTGKLQIHAVDLVLPGNGGLDIRVRRACLLR